MTSLLSVHFIKFNLLVGIPKGLHTVYVHFANPNISAPSSALRFSLNKDQSQYFGEKYEVKKVHTVRELSIGMVII